MTCWQWALHSVKKINNNKKKTLAVEVLLAEDTVEGKFDVRMTLALLLG